jgi:hypothetical protein
VAERRRTIGGPLAVTPARQRPAFGHDQTVDQLEDHVWIERLVPVVLRFQRVSQHRRLHPAYGAALGVAEVSSWTTGLTTG